jgi:predicted outer membrane repeat protein
MFLSWLRQRKLAGRTHRRGRGPGCAKDRNAFRPRIEALEDRWLPSTLTVLNTADSGTGSLRAEIAAASSGDTIVSDSSLNGQTITLTSGELVINQSLKIQGPGAGLLKISGNYASANASRVFDITSNKATVVLSGLTVANGFATEGAGIDNQGNLTVNNCTFTNNAAVAPGKNAKDEDGAIDNQGTLTLSNSTFLDNFAVDGGAIENHGNMTVSSSTFSDNGAFNYGGAIANDRTMTIAGCTFAAILSGNFSEFGGAIANNGTMTVSNSTFTGANSPNGSGGTIYNDGTMTVQGSNIKGVNESDFGTIINFGKLTLSGSTVTGGQVGVWNQGNLDITDASTVCNNVGADVYNFGQLTISSDSTVCVILSP